MYFKNYKEGSKNIEKAVKLNPNNGEILLLQGAVLNYTGEAQRGLDVLQYALRVDSFVSPTWDMHVGLANILLDKCEEAITSLERSIERAPEYLPAYLYGAWAQIELGQPIEAKNKIRTILKTMPKFTVQEMTTMLPFQSEETSDRLVTAIRAAGLPES